MATWSTTCRRAAATFRIASVSKQLPAPRFLLLAAEGSCRSRMMSATTSLPCPIWHRITIAQLMHNTSGIRDMLEIMRLGGSILPTMRTGGPVEWRVPAARTEFRPGSRYLYSNSNFMLLGRIVEQVRLNRCVTDFSTAALRPSRMTRRVTSNARPKWCRILPPAISRTRRLDARAQLSMHGEGGLGVMRHGLRCGTRNFGLPRVGGEALAGALMTVHRSPTATPTPMRVACGQAASRRPDDRS